MIELDKNAPVSQRDSIEIDAPVGNVWNILANINRWPEWNDDIKSAKLEGKLQPGTVFKWKSGPGTITSTLQAVEPGRLIAWTGQTMGIKAVHIWHLEAKAGKTVVTTEESWDGLPARLLKGYSRKMLEDAICSGLKKLKAAAER